MLKVEQFLEHLVGLGLDLLIPLLHKLHFFILRHELSLLLRHLHSRPILHTFPLFLLILLHNSQGLSLQLKLLNHPQIFRMLLILPPLLILLRLVILHITPQHPHLLVKFTPEIEVVKLSKSQLTVVIV